MKYKISAVLLKDAQYSKGCLMIPVPKEVRDYVLKEIAPNIPFQDLNTEQNETLFGIEPETHITLLYGPEGDVKPALAKHFTKPITIKTTGKIGYFDNEDASVAYLAVESPDLAELHYKLRDELPNNQREGDYVPHITIAYLKPGSRLDSDKVKEFEWEVSKILCGNPGGDVNEILVGGEEPEEHVKLIANIKRAWDESGYADLYPPEIYYENKDHFFGNLGNNEDYNDYTNWRGSFYGLPHMRRRIEDMMTSEIDAETSNAPVSEKSEEGDDAGTVKVDDDLPGKDYEDFVTTVRTDTNVPRQE
jgi:2'-5' RNA ligase